MKVRTMKKFTCDALVRLAVQKRKTAKAKPAKVQTPTADTTPRIDLNEIHRRFWARLRGEE